MPQLTSLKVSREAHDLLAVAARARGITIRTLVDELSREAADKALMEQAAQQMRDLQETDPGAWAEYISEGRAWEEGTVEPLDT